MEPPTRQKARKCLAFDKQYPVDDSSQDCDRQELADSVCIDASVIAEAG